MYYTTRQLTLMCQQKDKICPRCLAKFECRVGDITRCQCYTIKLDDAERDFLSQSYNDCLCADCMLALRMAYHQAQNEIRLKQFFGQR